jgi:plastocyanin
VGYPKAYISVWIGIIICLFTGGGEVAKRFAFPSITVAVILIGVMACTVGPKYPSSETEVIPTTNRLSPSPPPEAPTASTGEATKSSEKENTSQGTGREVLVEMTDLGGGSESYAYLPADFTFQLGETITFNLITQGEFHTFTIDDLEIDVSIDAESSDTFTYTFDKPGTFELICIPHQFLGMIGTIKVQ